MTRTQAKKIDAHIFQNMKILTGAMCVYKHVATDLQNHSRDDTKNISVKLRGQQRQTSHYRSRGNNVGNNTSNNANNVMGNNNQWVWSNGLDHLQRAGRVMYNR